MKTFFVEQADKPRYANRILKKVLKKDNKIIIYADMNNLKAKTKVVKKIRNILTQQKSRQIVLENELKKDVEFMNLLYSNNINICSSKWLFKRLTNEIIKCTLGEKKQAECQIWICVNDVDTITEQYIYEFAKEFKTLTIITNHIGKFRKIENKLYEDEGILINITNNRKKGLRKAKLILNIDFPKELLNQFVIFDDAIIINIDEDMKIRKKRFCGKIINDFQIEIEKQDEIIEFVENCGLENYDVKDICQAVEVIPKCTVSI